MTKKKTELEKCLAGEYFNGVDPELWDMTVRTKRLLKQLNATDYTDLEIKICHLSSDVWLGRRASSHRHRFPLRIRSKYPHWQPRDNKYELYICRQQRDTYWQRCAYSFGCQDIHCHTPYRPCTTCHAQLEAWSVNMPHIRKAHHH